MTTDLTARQAVLYATLAAATKACPECKGKGGWGSGQLHGDGSSADEMCVDCGGTGEVTMFPDCRQVCPCLDRVTGGPTEPLCLHCFKALYEGGTHDACTHCNGLGEQVCAGGLAAGLAGLSRGGAVRVADAISNWIASGDYEWSGRGHGSISAPRHDPMPDAGTILVKTLELVCEVAGLKVPDATTD